MVPEQLRIAASSVCAAAALAFVVGCGSLTDPHADSARCEQTHEFGNSGCADVEGVVTYSGGDAAGWVNVFVRYVGGRTDSFGYATTATDANGRFRLRVTRYMVGPPAAGPDTASFFVIATDLRPLNRGLPPTVRDSVLTRVTIAPVGRRPETTTVSIVLVVP